MPLDHINKARFGLMNNQLGITSEPSVGMVFSSLAQALYESEMAITNFDLIKDFPQITGACKEEVYKALAELDSIPTGADPVAQGAVMFASSTVTNAVKAKALICAGAKLDKVTPKEIENINAIYDTAKKTEEVAFTTLEQMFSSSSLSSDSSSTMSSFFFMISPPDSSSQVLNLSQSLGDTLGRIRLSSLFTNPLFRDETPSSDAPVNKEKPSEVSASTTTPAETPTVVTTLELDAQADAEKSKEELTQIQTRIVDLQRMIAELQNNQKSFEAERLNPAQEALKQLEKLKLEKTQLVTKMEQLKEKAKAALAERELAETSCNDKKKLAKDSSDNPLGKTGEELLKLNKDALEAIEARDQAKLNCHQIAQEGTDALAALIKLNDALENAQKAVTNAPLQAAAKVAENAQQLRKAENALAEAMTRAKELEKAARDVQLRVDQAAQGVSSIPATILPTSSDSISSPATSSVVDSTQATTTTTVSTPSAPTAEKPSDAPASTTETSDPAPSDDNRKAMLEQIMERLKEARENATTITRSHTRTTTVTLPVSPSLVAQADLARKEAMAEIEATPNTEQELVLANEAARKLEFEAQTALADAAKSKEELIQIQNRIADLQKNVEELQQKQKPLEEAVERWNIAAGEAEQKAAKLKNDKAELDAQLKRLDIQETEAKAQLILAQNALTELEKRGESVVKKPQGESPGDIIQLGRDVQQAIKTKNEAQEKVNQAVLDCDRAQRNLDQVNLDLQHAMQEAADLSIKATEADQEVSEMAMQLGDAEESLALETTKAKELEKTVAESEAAAHQAQVKAGLILPPTSDPASGSTTSTVVGSTQASSTMSVTTPPAPTKEEISAQLKIALASLLTKKFWEMTTDEQSARAAAVVTKLPEDTQPTIKNYILEKSTDPMKTQNEWIDNHMGDNLSLLYEAFGEAIKRNNE